MDKIAEDCIEWLNPLQVMTAAIQYGSRTIDFRLEYSDRKSLGITVTPKWKC